MSLLEQAIVDAQELKEAALKSAESAILEKYSADIREAVDNMLEQEEEIDPLSAMMGGMPEEEEDLPEEEIPFAAEAELKLCPCPDDEAQVEISFKELELLSQELDGEAPVETEEDLAMAMGAEEEEDAIPMMESIDLDELLEACGEMMPMDSMEHPMEHEEESGDVKNITINLGEGDTTSAMPDMAAMPDMDMDMEMPDDMDVTMESLTAIVREAVNAEYDLGGAADGWDGHGSQGMAASKLEHELDLEEAGSMPEEDQSDKSVAQKALDMRLAEAMNAKDAQIKDLKENLQTLAESSDKLKQTFMLMREQFEETNLSNAKLLYTNRTLKSTSLNERQKNRIVESIQSADTIEEAKVIYETLQSTVGESRKSTPKSLNEAISRPSMNVPRRRKGNSSRESAVKNRFQALAGIKK